MTPKQLKALKRAWSRGGETSANNMTKKQRSERARKAALAGVAKRRGIISDLSAA